MFVNVCKVLVEPRSGKPVKATNDGEDLTVAFVIVDVLIGPTIGGVKLSEKEHIERYDLALKVIGAEKSLIFCDLSAQERTKIMNLVAEKWATMIVGQMSEALNDPPPKQETSNLGQSGQEIIKPKLVKPEAKET